MRRTLGALDPRQTVGVRGELTLPVTIRLDPAMCGRREP
jgi:hypothetical protein